ncbi:MULTISPECIES: cbb3-type cytochrome oxidase assembly protein CcoS [Crateriforma]|uniref:Cytochrome oxidase maturation protein cbb3-type n=1 Tax=Crateriforma conspicua TaxID=2527996 RepID=A0A5C6FV36_9PLAN|nr:MULTISPECIES: cbb3-type cytochrome oxidase assembly protein CcoS [Crateriforma]QDV65350.1 Cytochrome oxidase maturation protein cbb3-type [Crateriforma conspicua]TWT70742.1 Cytochrome oxidase maturation protein cbb3-type [Crateriforma conspicua]TWU65320.1 Cytochrome oxidase maturation protein cbb3-type [Crateriforma conspicua]
MSVLFIALPVAIAMGATALWACVRCIRGGQFDDLESPPIRMLIDDAPSSSDPQDATSADAKR